MSSSVHIIWDLPDEPHGNVQHLLEHDITVEECEEILLAYHNLATTSRTSGNPLTFGWTSTGKYLAVVFEKVSHDPLTLYPITAFLATPPRTKRSWKRTKNKK